VHTLRVQQEIFHRGAKRKKSLEAVSSESATVIKYDETNCVSEGMFLKENFHITRASHPLFRVRHACAYRIAHDFPQGVVMTGVELAPENREQELRRNAKLLRFVKIHC
jgi:hypothetical protein